MIILKEEIIVDVRTREEYYREHIENALNIPLHDLKFYFNFLKGKKVYVYCNSGVRSKIARKLLENKKIDAEALKSDWYKKYVIIKNKIISAVNYIEIRPDKKDDFQKNIKKLCQSTNEVEGFLGSKLLKISGVSGIGSFLTSESDLNFEPEKYIIITYWNDKESHNKSHKLKFFKEIYNKLPEYSIKMPYEEFYEILK